MCCIAPSIVAAAAARAPKMAMMVTTRRHSSCALLVTPRPMEWWTTSDPDCDSRRLSVPAALIELPASSHRLCLRRRIRVVCPVEAERLVVLCPIRLRQPMLLLEERQRLLHVRHLAADPI
mmetsp:Transcript_29511/g.96393  ORF Transcript_29511/g.96393 Transcript_29511/m.96393 type:complete len:121 (-) Transcript_29511:713-1075(-)